MNQYVKRKQDGFVQFNYAQAAKYVMISENMNIQNVIQKETGISSLRVFIVGGNLRIFKVKTLQMSQQLSESTLCGRWINVWMAATSFQFFHKCRNPSDELCSAFKDKITTTKQYSSLVSTTQEDKDL